jgi:phosphatidylserine decarboxylase
MVRASPTKKIQPFVEELDIDMSTAQKQEFNSFNEFLGLKIEDDV